MRLIRALRDCKQRSLTVSKKAPTVGKKASPDFKLLQFFQIASGLDLKSLAIFRARPPGLLQHVLTVLVFLSWVLLLPRPPVSSRSPRLCPCASILLHGPLDICLDLLPAAPSPPVQERNAQHMFLQHGGAHAEIWASKNLAHQNRTIAIASDFRVDGAKSPEIPQKEGVLGSEIAARNRKSLATFHRTLKSQCSIALSCLGNRAISGVRDGHRNRKSQKSLRFRCAKSKNVPQILT